jgi:hypothetical protein
MVSNQITFTGFTVMNAYNLISQVSGNDHNLNNLILTDFVNYGMSVLAAHDCTFSDITIHTNDVSMAADRTVKGIDIQEYASGGNTNNQFVDITIHGIETTGTFGTSMGIFFEGDNPDTHPTTGNTFTKVDIYDLASEYFNYGVYILDSGTGVGHTAPYAIEDTTFSVGSIYGFTENGVDVVSRGFYVKGGNKNLDITCFDITGCDDGVYFKSFAGTIPPTFPPTGWINDDSWATSTGSSWVGPHSGAYAAGVEMGTSTPDDYLIMPQQSITSGNSVSLYARGSFMFGSAYFKLLVSTTGTDSADFTELGTYPITGYMGSWSHVSEDLSAYDGQDIYIAIYADEQVVGPSAELLIDDVTLPDGSTEGFEGATTTVGAIDVTVNCNDIHGNTNHGVDNSNGVGTIDATNNWWGDSSGPGGAVSNNVDYNPWLTAANYTGRTLFQDTENVFLQATYINSDLETPGSVDFYFDGVSYNVTDGTDGVFYQFIGPKPVGVYSVKAEASDWCQEDEALVVVSSPGFITGGGWIDSPLGAYVDNPSLTGKATFGFVAKYDKKTEMPEGNTEFVFKAGDLNFHSSSYDWLMVNKATLRAQFKGEGTINGDYAPNDNLYKFMLWAGDGDPDTFRIMIWWEDESDSVEHVVYDNVFDQEIGGGSIVIHTRKK